MRKDIVENIIITGYSVTVKDRSKNQITYVKKLALMESRTGILIGNTRENIVSIYNFI